jgi:hypothetical protein
MMRITRSALLLFGAALALASGVASAQISITRNADLRFGSLTVGGAAGTVVITPAGARSTTGSVAGIGAAFGAASFTVSVPSGNPHYTFTLPTSATLTDSGSATMTVDTFTSNPACCASQVAGSSRTEVLTVGATLHVGANQAAGSYSGTFFVTVIQN